MRRITVTIAVRNFLIGIGGLLLLFFLGISYRLFMDECVKSGHTRTYCEFEYWK